MKFTTLFCTVLAIGLIGSAVAVRFERQEKAEKRADASALRAEYYRGYIDGMRGMSKAMLLDAHHNASEEEMFQQLLANYHP